MNLKYPSLLLNHQSLLNTMRQLQTKEPSLLRANEWVKLARCAYYLRDPQAASYLHQAAQQQATTINQQFASLNFYRMAGDWTAMHECFRNLPAKPASANQWQQATYRWAFFQALFWLGDDHELIEYYQREAALQAIQLAGLMTQLAEARLKRNSLQALTVAQRLATTIREERIEPWSNLPLNLWDLYELSCQLLNPPLSIDAPVLEISPNPAQRLIELLQAQQIMALEWSIYNNNDEAEEGYCYYLLADGTTRLFNQGIVNQELERLVWDMTNFDWSLPGWQPYGLYRLEVASAKVHCVGQIWSQYEHAAMVESKSEWLGDLPTYPTSEHALNPDLLVVLLPNPEERMLDLTRWNGEQRSY
ncbi:hypothetical protein ACP8Y2_16890 [Herpetosiphon llansteffanensis]